MVLAGAQSNLTPMPTASIIYTAHDGARFDTKSEAIAHEHLIADVQEAMKPLGEVPQAVKDGKGWVQHSETSYRTAHRALCRLSAPLVKGFGHVYAACMNAPDAVHPFGIMGRIMDDTGGPLARAWSRLGCIDRQFREHQQPYYATHGPCNGQVCVEDRR